jgi:hypothetical protein
MSTADEARAWLRDQVDAGRLTRAIDNADLARIAAVLIRNDERGGSTPRVRHRRKEVRDVSSIEPTSAAG